MFVGFEIINKVFQYNLSTAWDISTATAVGTGLTVDAGAVTGLKFNTTGTSMYVVLGNGNQIQQWNLSTAFDLSTATAFGLFSVTGGASPQGIAFNPTGTKVFIITTNNDRINEYNLSTAFNITTAVLSNFYTVGTQTVNPADIFFKSDGLKLFLLGDNSIFQYESIAVPVITFPASLQNPPTTAYTASQKVTYSFFTLNGGTTFFLSTSSLQPNVIPGLINGSSVSSLQSAPNLTVTTAQAIGASSIALGNNAQALQATDIAIGSGSLCDTSSGAGGVAIGFQAKIQRERGVAIGYNANQAAGGDAFRAVSIGINSLANNGDTIAIGSSPQATASNSNAIGADARATAAGAIAIGSTTRATATNAVALGNGVTAATANTVTLRRLQMLDYATLNFADDAAAAAGGIPLGGVYHTSGTVKVRIA
jgi:hypothetical protein